MALNPKQEAFVHEYLIDFNATQAAIRAGYSTKTAGSQAHDLLKKPEIQAKLKEGQARLAEKTETEAEWVRRRLKEEADDFTEFASHSARIRALELLGKVNGIFEVDNKQKVDPVASLVAAVLGNVQGVAKDDE
jgi:phage terminase small subunit